MSKQEQIAQMRAREVELLDALREQAQRNVALGSLRGTGWRDPLVAERAATRVDPSLSTRQGVILRVRSRAAPVVRT